MRKVIEYTPVSADGDLPADPRDQMLSGPRRWPVPS
jgi:hypothetical protein